MPNESKPYKDTLNLPVTRFEMKANLTSREPQIQARWRSQNLYESIRTARAGRQLRVLHDGPPYANGDIHLGHLLNKVLKDMVVRFLTLAGFDSPYVPGWDCHGLPIEHKVMKDLGSKAATLSPTEIRELCRVEALKWVDTQRRQFERLGVMGDWKNPYLTLDPGYEASIIDVLADLVDAGHVFRQLRPIHWCVNDRTALAEAELEYHDATSPSIYVNFPMLSGVPAEWGRAAWHVMIWTTTPWTLPANVAIAAHPEVEYAGVAYLEPDTGEHVHTILAADLVEKVLGLRGISVWSELGRVPGRVLEHAQYRHVFLDRTSPLVLADYVTVDDGTGLVHTAPGHGTDDFRTGKNYQLPTLSPVDETGRFSNEAPDWLVGQNVFRVNPLIIERLKSTRSLYHASEFSHSYPHCWRCKKPVIFRATSQWFVSVDHADLRGRTLKVIAEDVRWLPSWGRGRIEGMVQNRPDWCVSRQRHWGVPIPALYDDQTGEPHMTAESLRFYRDLFRSEGADAWFRKPIEELLPPDLDLQGFPVEQLRKGADILDVWFESGSSHRAVLSQNYELGFPAFMYLEGSDQHRGWFQSSILTAVATNGRAPFETVLTHGFIVDEHGEKMSKSEGNAISAVKATETHGADVLRLYVASMDYSDDVRVSERGIKEASEAYRKIRNTFRFLLGNLEDYTVFDPGLFDVNALHMIDRWLLGELNTLIREVTAAFERFEFYKGYQRLYHFCSQTLSSLYLEILKDRLYADAPASSDRRAAQFVLARLHKSLTIMFSPILPHTSEEVWEFQPKTGGTASSVHLADWPAPDERWDDPELTQTMLRVLELRDRTLESLEALRRNKEIGSSLEAVVTYSTIDSELATFLGEYRELLQTVMAVSSVNVAPPEAPAQQERADSIVIKARRSEAPKCHRCWNLRDTVGSDAAYPTLCNRCVQVLQALA
jgi:isoleucyl-tRNA synthetase